MTKDEIVVLVEVVASLWPNAPRYETHHLRGFHLLLKDVPLAAAEAALASIAAEGDAFPPAPGQILRRANDLASPVPDWGAAWQEALDWVHAHGYMDPPGPDSFSHPAIYVAVHRIGYQALCESNTADAEVWMGHFRRVYDGAIKDHRLAPARAAVEAAANPFALPEADA